MFKKAGGRVRSVLYMFWGFIKGDLGVLLGGLLLKKGGFLLLKFGGVLFC